jgi:hypothetical protein
MLRDTHGHGRARSAGGRRDSHVDSRRVRTDGGLPDDAPSDSDDASVSDRLGSLLYAGESARAAMRIEGGYLVATSHRLLAYTPESDGANLRVVHRPNAEAVGHDASGNTRLLKPLAYSVGGGLLLVVLGATLSFESMAGVVPTVDAGLGVASVLSQIASVLALVALVDELMSLLGALALIVGVALTGTYLYTRQSEVVVTVAGSENLRLSAGTATEANAESFAAEAGVDYSPPSFRSS